MNKIYFLALMVLSLNSFASKARIAALNNSFHLIDSQHIYTALLDINSLDNLINFETGATTPATGFDNAEATLIYSLNDKSKLALSVGHQPAWVTDSRSFINSVGATTYKLAQNPIYAIYGIKDEMTSYAFGFYYSNENNKTLLQKESSSGLLYGVELGKLQLYGELGLENSAESAAGQRFSGVGFLSLNVGYNLDATSFLLSITRTEMKSLTLATENEFHVKQVLTLSLVDSRLREGNDVFWGAQVVSTKIDCRVMASVACDKSASSVKFPVWVGLEVLASENLVARGSIVQSLLFNQTKDDVGYPTGILIGSNGTVTDLGVGSNDTVVALGLGLKFNKLIIDGTLSTSTTQIINATSLASQVALTYNY